MMTRNRIRFSKGFVYVFLLAFAGCLFLYLDFQNTSVPYDDAYSVFMIKASYSDIAAITASDVHPPLYYWGLKAFSQLFGDNLFTLRIFSTLGIFAILLLGCFPIREMFGDKVAILFLILIIIFPVTQYLVSDIRMYSWTMFFVLACALSACKVFEKGNIRDWTIFFLTGICAAYLHNYGLLSILGVYLILLVSLIAKKKNLIKLLTCGLLFTIAYSPWLFQLIGQIKDVSDEYWIKPLNVNDLFLHIYYFYSPKEVWLPFTDFTKPQMMIGLIFLMTIQLILTLKVIISLGWKDGSVRMGILSFSAFLFPILVGASISVFYMPILVTRYMTCSFGLLVLSMALILAKGNELPVCRKLLCIFLFLLFIDGGIRLYSNIKYYKKMEIANQDIREFTENGDTFLVNDFSFHVMPRIELIAPGHNYYVLESGKNKEPFAPFAFNIVEDEAVLDDEFILVHQEREAIQSDFEIYKMLLKERYIVADSLHASDIYLYRMKKLDIIN